MKNSKRIEQTQHLVGLKLVTENICLNNHNFIIELQKLLDHNDRRRPIHSLWDGQVQERAPLSVRDSVPVCICIYHCVCVSVYVFSVLVSLKAPFCSRWTLVCLTPVNFMVLNVRLYPWWDWILDNMLCVTVWILFKCSMGSRRA